MALQFPASPDDGDIYENYQWNDTDGVWELIPVPAPAEAAVGFARSFLTMGA